MAELFKVFFVTLFFSLGVQCLFYLRYSLGSRKIIREHKAVFAYKSGIIGDSVLIPATNVAAWIVLSYLYPLVVDLNTLLLSVLGGLFITFLLHWSQQRLHLTNWTMPQPGHWTLLGVYHAIFMCIETGFLTFVLSNYLSDFFSREASVSGAPLYLAIIILTLFFITFAHDYWPALFSKFFR